LTFVKDKSTGYLPAPRMPKDPTEILARGIPKESTGQPTGSPADSRPYGRILLD